MKRAPTTATALFTSMITSFFMLGCGLIARPGQSRMGAEVLEQLPEQPPVAISLGDCSAEGSAPDRTLNLPKNRVDSVETGAWQPVPWTVIAHLPWPRNTNYRFRQLWTAGQRQEVARYESRAIEIEGYLDGFTLEGAEPPNCYERGGASQDCHLWIVEQDGEPRRTSIVAELTPRVRLRHPGWTDERMAAVVRTHARVRLRGWLLLDQMHPELVGITRGTLWEVHPVLELSVRQATGWVPLDSLSVTAVDSAPARRTPGAP